MCGNIKIIKPTISPEAFIKQLIQQIEWKTERKSHVLGMNNPIEDEKTVGKTNHIWII